MLQKDRARVIAEEREKEWKKKDVYIEDDGKRTTDIACLTMFNEPERFVTHFSDTVLKVTK